MKKVFAIVAIVACALACEPEVQNYVKLADAEQEATLAFGVKGGEKTVVIATDAAWTATADQTWLTVEPASGAAGEAVELTVSVPAENTSYDNLSATITIAAGNAAPLQIAVTQSQTDALIIDEAKTSFEIDAKGGDIVLPVSANVTYTIKAATSYDGMQSAEEVEGCNWITIGETRALATTNTTLTVAPYAGCYDKLRYATLEVEAEGFEAQEIVITQYSPKSETLWSANLTTAFAPVTTTTLHEGTDFAYTTGAVVSMALYDGKLVVCPGNGSAPVLLNKTTGAVEGTLNTGDFKPYHVTNDDAGNLILNNRNWNGVWDYQFFEVRYMKPGDATVYSAFVAGDFAYNYAGTNVTVRGDITANALVATPKSGYTGITNEKNVYIWSVANGTATPVTLPITGFTGISWWAGGWAEAPNNFPSFEFISTNPADGAIMLTGYDENGLYKVDATGAATLLTIVANGDYGSNAICLKDKYLAVKCSTFFTWAPAKLDVFDTTTMQHIFSATTNDTFDATRAYGVTSDVVMEKVDNALVIYYIDNNTSAMEAFKLAL